MKTRFKNYALSDVAVCELRMTVISCVDDVVVSRYCTGVTGRVRLIVHVHLEEPVVVLIQRPCWWTLPGGRMIWQMASPLASYSEYRTLHLAAGSPGMAPTSKASEMS
jgi:hypothetical protein